MNVTNETKGGLLIDYYKTNRNNNKKKNIDYFF